MTKSNFQLMCSLHVPLIVCLILTLASSSAFVLLSHDSATSTRQVNVGGKYEYTYIVETLLTEAPVIGTPIDERLTIKANATVGHQIVASVQTAVQWQDPNDPNLYLIRIKLSTPNLHIRSRKAPSPEGFLQHTSNLESIKPGPAYILWQQGRIKEIYTSEDESISAINLLIGVANLFQFQTVDGEVEETNPSGSCTVNYKTSSDVRIVNKMVNCGSKPVYSRPISILGAKIESYIESEINLPREDLMPEKITLEEVHVLRAILPGEPGGLVTSKQTLELVTKSNGADTFEAATSAEAMQMISKKMNVKLKHRSIVVTREDSPLSPKGIEEILVDVRDGLDATQIGTLRSANAFMKLLPAARISSKQDFIRVLKSVKNKDIIPQLLDVLAATQSKAAHQAAKTFLNFPNPTDIDLAERYLLAISLSTHPSDELLKDILKLCRQKIDNDKFEETLILTLAALTKTHGSLPKAKAALVVESVSFLTSELEKCSDDSCKQMYLRGLKNVASPQFLSILLKHATNGSAKVTVTALKALDALPVHVIDNTETIRSLIRIFLQLDNKYDSSARTLAVDLLLKMTPSSETVNALLGTLNRQDNREVKSYVFQRTLEFAGKNKQLLALAKECLKGREFLNYNVLAPGGISTAFSRLLTSDVRDNNASFSSSLEMRGGVMRRNSFDILVNGENGEQFQSLQYSIYAAGLSSFASSSSSSGQEEQTPDEEEDTTAGLELSLMGVQLRPFVFFNGNGELMGHIWSGTGSERTTALNVVALLQDFLQYIPLQNGLTAEFQLQGALSYDFAGQVQVSLWNREAHSLVENNGAILVQGIVRTEASYVSSQVEFRAATEPSLHLVADMNFYDDVALCLQLQRPDSVVRHSIHKIERIPGSKHRLRKSKYRSSIIPGCSFHINDKNAQHCAKLFGDNSKENS